MLLNPDCWAFSIRSSFKNLKQVLFVRFKVFAKGIFSHIGKKSPVKTQSWSEEIPTIFLSFKMV